MRSADLPAYLRDRVLGMLLHPAPTGLMRIETPGCRSPVPVTGNFTLTVRRLRDALRGRDAWLLVANSKRINVWCAVGGAHLTHHDIISVIRTSRIAERVDHRKILAAAGSSSSEANSDGKSSLAPAEPPGFRLRVQSGNMPTTSTKK